MLGFGAEEVWGALGIAGPAVHPDQDAMPESRGQGRGAPLLEDAKRSLRGHSQRPSSKDSP